MSKDPVWSHIKTAFAFVADKAHVALVVEGEPFKKSLTDTEVRAIKTDGSASELIEQVANAYDYEASSLTKTEGRELYLLKKRYSDPDDLPFVSLAQLRAVCADMYRLTASFDPAPGAVRIKSGTALAQFAASLSPNQIEAMKDPSRGISVQRLTTPQRDQVLSGPIKVYLLTTEQYLKSGIGESSIAADSSALMGKVGPKTARAFGYEGPSTADDGKPVRVYRFLGENYDFIKPRVTYQIPGQTRGEQADALSVAPPRPARPAEERLSQRLHDATDQLQARAAPFPTVVVDPEIATEPVWIVNAPAAAPETLLRGLSALYNHRLTTKADGSHQISRVQPKARTIAELPAALAQIMPDSFSRATHWRAIARESLKPRVFDTPAASIAPPTIAYHAVSAQTLKVRAAALNFLQNEVEPRLTETARKLPVPSLTDASQAAFADIILSDVWDAILLRVVYPTPDYILHLDDAIVMGGYMDYDKPLDGLDGFHGTDGLNRRAGADSAEPGAKTGFAVRFYYRDADGKLKDTHFGGSIDLRAVGNPK